MIASAVVPTADARDHADPAAAVRAAFQAYDDGWRRGKVAEIVDAFAPSFEWTNEVGVHIVDKARLTRFLDHVFKEPNYLAGKPGPLKIHAITLLGRDVAVVSCSESTFGQKDDSGRVVRELRSNELTVLRRIGGRWLIVSDLTSDESHGI